MICMFNIQSWTMVFSWKVNVSAEHTKIFTNDLLQEEDQVPLTWIQAAENTYLHKTLRLEKETTQTRQTGLKNSWNLENGIRSVLLKKIRNPSASKIHIERFQTQSFQLYEGKWLRSMFCNLLWGLNVLLCMIVTGFFYSAMLFRFFDSSQGTSIVRQPLQTVKVQVV